MTCATMFHSWGVVRVPRARSPFTVGRVSCVSGPDGREASMTVTADQLATAAIDQMLALVALAKVERKPIEWLEDRLLDMRLEVTA